MTVRYYLDTEFNERPHTIELISIGIVCEDGRELYLKSSEIDWGAANSWVLENVKPIVDGMPGMPRSEIRDRVLELVGNDTPEFWGYYADYDWVVFCWLFGAMVDLPKGWPMYCRDLKQLSSHTGIRPPPQRAGHHDALQDARWVAEAHRYILNERRAMGFSE